MGTGKAARNRGATIVEIALLLIGLFVMGAASAKALGHSIATRANDARDALRVNADVVTISAGLPGPAQGR